MRLNPLREVTRPTRHSPRRSFRHPTCVSQKRGFSWARNRSLNPEPRQRTDYSDRQIEAARRVLVDLGQVLARFEDCLVVVGGWVPDLLLANADEPHSGRIDESRARCLQAVRWSIRGPPLAAVRHETLLLRREGFPVGGDG